MQLDPLPLGAEAMFCCDVAVPAPAPASLTLILTAVCDQLDWRDPQPRSVHLRNGHMPEPARWFVTARSPGTMHVTVIAADIKGSAQKATLTIAVR
ncbi:MAG: hypothetical protein HC828_17100 [Blastochloris sp.]|nr:hypothetical protein [Blastochloris sp.]